MIPHPSRLVGVFAFAVLLGGCVSVEQSAPRVTPQMAALGKTPVATLEEGRHLYTGRCAACHSVDPVAKHSPEHWRDIMDDMAGKAKLSPAEKSAVLAYIMAARQTPTVR
jgi:mono/diheme cytochrome c family protein